MRSPVGARLVVSSAVTPLGASTWAGSSSIGERRCGSAGPSSPSAHWLSSVAEDDTATCAVAYDNYSSSTPSATRPSSPC
jgi:hypothetical protein